MAPAEVPVAAVAPAVAQAEVPAPATEPASATSAVPEHRNRLEADNEVAASEDGAAAAAGGGVVCAGPGQEMVSRLNYAETLNMPVGTSIGIVTEKETGADGG